MIHRNPLFAEGAMDQTSGTVLDFFTTVEDPRQRGKVVYRLDEILLIVLGGCLAGEM